MDTVFSFDSIITAVGLARQVPVMITAVIIAMIIMFFFSQKIADYINRRPTLKILALSFLLMVGFSLFFEGLEPGCIIRISIKGTSISRWPLPSESNC